MTQHPENWYSEGPRYSYIVSGSLLKSTKVIERRVRAPDEYSAQEKFLKRLRKTIGDFNHIHIDLIRTSVK